jgi:hypothetical protein
MHAALAAVAAVSVSLAAVPAFAETDRTVSPSSYHLDLEADPTAYALSGYSAHLGLGFDHVRVDLGVYAMHVPQFVHGDDGYDVRFNGLGTKVQYFFATEQRGWFAGVDADFAWIRASRQGTDASDLQRTFGLGVDAGYRISLPVGFYVTPWLGLGYQFGTKDVTIAGATYKSSPITVFPAIHLGYRFL